MPNGYTFQPKDQFQQFVVDKFELGTQKMQSIEKKIDCLPCEKHEMMIQAANKNLTTMSIKVFGILLAGSIICTFAMWGVSLLMEHFKK